MEDARGKKGIMGERRRKELREIMCESKEMKSGKKLRAGGKVCESKEEESNGR